ncbi:MAG: penicillin-insensitive murein endopeptidase [Pseudomonadota bacterium]
MPIDTIPAADLFAGVARPAGGPAIVHGRTSRGCFTGGVALAGEGATWQVMRPSRNRYYAHARTVAAVERLAALAPSLGLRGILVGDLSQPAGGPMPWGHLSHQSGLDADIWFAEMPEPRLTVQERETIEMQSMLTPDGIALDTTLFTAPFARLVAAAASMGEVQRIFVHPQINTSFHSW